MCASSTYYVNTAPALLAAERDGHGFSKIQHQGVVLNVEEKMFIVVIPPLNVYTKSGEISPSRNCPWYSLFCPSTCTRSFFSNSYMSYNKVYFIFCLFEFISTWLLCDGRNIYLEDHGNHVESRTYSTQLKGLLLNFNPRVITSFTTCRIFLSITHFFGASSPEHF